MSPWTEENTALLRTWAAEGCSSRVCSQRFAEHGVKLTASAVTGRLNRLGIPRDTKIVVERDPGVWTEENVTLLRQFALAGNSPADCVAEFKKRGIAMEYDVVIGKMWRLKLRGRHAEGLPKFGAHRSPAERAPKFTDLPAHLRDEAPTWKSLPDSRPVPIVCLPANGCRWPVGQNEDGDAVFCGGHITFKSYCSNHARIGYAGGVNG